MTGIQNKKNAYLPSPGVLLFEPFPPPEKGSIIEHIVAVWIQGPVAALPRLFVIAGHFHKTLVQRKVVADGILPALQHRTVFKYSQDFQGVEHTGRNIY